MEARVIGILKTIMEVTVTVAAAAGVFIAWRAGNDWRRQLKGNAEYELARSALYATYKVRDAIGVVRNPIMSSGEQAAALTEMEPDTKELKDDTEELLGVRAQAAAFSVRWRGVSEALRDLDVARLEAEALWGSENAACLTSMRPCASELSWALRMYFMRQQQSHPASAPSDLDETIERTLFFSGGAESEDAYSMRLQQAVESVEMFIRPRLK